MSPSSKSGSAAILATIGSPLRLDEGSPFGRSQTPYSKGLRQPAIGSLRRPLHLGICDSAPGGAESLREIADPIQQGSAPAGASPGVPDEHHPVANWREPASADPVLASAIPALREESPFVRIADPPIRMAGLRQPVFGLALRRLTLREGATSNNRCSLSRAALSISPELPQLSENELQSKLDLARGGGVEDLHESRSVNGRPYRSS